MGGEMDRWEKLGGLGNISLSIYFAMIHSVVFKRALFDQSVSYIQLMEFNMLKLSQKLKLMDQRNKKTWISLRFTLFEYSFYILQLLRIFCHFVHPKYP